MTVIRHFLLLMQLHPEVAFKARKEIDSVVGTGRLPTLSDRPSLPYVNAVMSECLRWGAPVPLGEFNSSQVILSSADIEGSLLGLPHRLMEDDVYNGMVIPCGTLVFANVWYALHIPSRSMSSPSSRNMTRNPDVFPDPESFNPERYMEEMDAATATARDPRNFVFGFGRRSISLPLPSSHARIELT